MIVLSGSDDGSVPPHNVEAIFKIYDTLGLNGADGTDGQNLMHVDTGASGHSFSSAYPEIMLSFLYEALGYNDIIPATSSTNNDNDGVLGTYEPFCQREFFPDDIDWESSKDFGGRQNGWIYTPAACQGEGSAGCRVHFVFHGCGASAKSKGKAGYNDLAAANNIIMVYPDVRCWDNEGDID